MGARLNHVFNTPNDGSGVGSADLDTLHEFSGNSSTGFKVAFSDRMISLYGRRWGAAFVYGLIKSRIEPLAILPWVLLMLPLASDGGSHFLSDVLAGSQVAFVSPMTGCGCWLAMLFPMRPTLVICGALSIPLRTW